MVGRSERVGDGAGGRLAVVHRVVVGVGLVVAVVGGMATWRAVDRLDEAHTRAALARNDMADVEAIIGARLDETVGRVGLDAGYSTGDADLRSYLSDLAEVAEDAGNQADVLVDDVVASEAELREDAAADGAADDGAADETLLVGLEGALAELERASVRAANDDAQAADDAARWTVVVVFVSSSALWAAAIWLTRAARRPR